MIDINAPEIWTADEIAQWLKLGRRHVAERIVHDPKFPRPIMPGPNQRKRWLKDDIIAWARGEM